MKKNRVGEYHLKKTVLGERLILCLSIFLCLSACGGKEIAGTNSNDAEQTKVSATENVEMSTSSGLSASDTKSSSEVEISKTSFGVTVPGREGSVALVPNADFSEVLPFLSDSYTYFEAPSCAFRGLDKIYTFNDFEIDTYPDGNTDRIYLISLMSDLIQTDEGLMIGVPESKIIELYGEPEEMNGSEYVYLRENSKLGVVVQNSTVAAITYYSTIQ